MTPRKPRAKAADPGAALHEDVLSPATARDFAALGALPALRDFYLAGGTALALRLGHRRSDDLDLFSERPWRWEGVSQALAGVGRVVVDRQDEDTFVGRVAGTRVSLFHYPYVLLEPLRPTRFGVPLASLIDIACMKLVAVGQRGSRKDFIDLYHLARAGVTVHDAAAGLRVKAPGIEYTVPHLARGLAYFDDAEAEPDPVMLVPHDWEAVKRFAVAQARALLADAGVELPD